ncbi:MAG: filamentous hemagglutinin N-terminal domain-containing protein [Leptolyngbya sp. SIO1E4]|nr:filamentous hemagglutinin N-terminal domain-containing protein [Leptolyngbya sp. SIO1E4]
MSLTKLHRAIGCPMNNLWQTIRLITPGLVSVLILSGAGWRSSSSAYGQIIPDNSLGVDASVVNFEGGVDLIQGGSTQGSALFHSFSDFNVNIGQQVYFANPLGIDTILSRVTGVSPSQIEGVLGVDGAANLFLLNPNGIIFGPDAQLDVAGSFVASTSDRFRFADGSEFRATNPNDAPLVTVNIPLGLQLEPASLTPILTAADLTVGQDLTLLGSEVTSTGQLSAPQGQITVRGSDGNVQVQALTAQSAQLLASDTLILEESRLVTTGDLSLGADNTLRIRDSAHAPFVAAAGGTLLFQGNNRVDIFALNHPESGLVAGGDLILRSANPVIGDAQYLAYGDFRIETLEGALGGLLSPNDPVIRASGDVAFESYEGASLHILAGGSVIVSGNITITGADPLNGLQETVPLSNGGSIDIDGQQQGTLDIRAGTLSFGAPGIVGGGAFIPAVPAPLDGPPTSADISIGSIIIPFDGQVFLTTQFDPNPELAGGDISLTGNNAIAGFPDDSIFANTGSVTLDARASISVAANITSVAGEDDAGDITLLAAGNITTGDLVSQTQPGNSGEIQVQAGGDIVTGNVLSQASGGSSSDVSLQAGGSINLTDVTVGSEAIDGDAANVSINGSQITISGETTITSDAIGDGTAGNVAIAGDQLDINDATVSSTATDGGSGNVSLSGDLITLSNADIRSATTGDGAAGAIDVGGSEVSILDSTLATVSNEGAATGNLTFSTDTLSVQASQLQVISPEGVAGALQIAATSVLLDQGSLLTETGAIDNANSGNITLSFAEEGSLTLRNESLISATGLSDAGTGANITLTGGAIVAEAPTGPDGSDIIANSVGNTGGEIAIEVTSLEGIEQRPARTPLNDIVGNEVTIIAPPPVPPTPPAPPVPPEVTEAVGAGVETETVYELPDFVDREAEEAFRAAINRCAVESAVTQGGRGGLPTHPTDLLQAIAPSTDWVRLTEAEIAPISRNRVSDSASSASDASAPSPALIPTRACDRG